MVKYAAVTASVQLLLGAGVLSTMYGRGPLVLLFLLPMVNIAYPWLTENAIRVELWPPAILAGTVFTFLVITLFGESTNWLKTWISKN